MTTLPVPEPGRTAAEAFVARHLDHLVCDEVAGSPGWSGGQRAADAALAAFDVAGYAAHRNTVLPETRRGASRLSPYIRHGLLSLPAVWRHVAAGPSRDVNKFRDELLWQEYSRHWYSRLGARTRRGVRQQMSTPGAGSIESGWDRRSACMDFTIGELHRDGWLVNQTRMWLASHWTVREGREWRDGEDHFFRHLLDGSRAANRLGWQWTTGLGSNRHYGFSRHQVEKRAPALCGACDLRHHCPIEQWPDDPPLRATDRPVELRRDPHGRRTVGPTRPVETSTPDCVWITAESLGTDDPAMRAHPELPVVFVFDEPLLAQLRLSSKRLVFLTETLAELATEHDVELHLGDPVELLADRGVAVTFAPVPGFRARAERLAPAETHPWPWLVTPTSGSISSFTAWRKSVRLPPKDPAVDA